MTKENRYLKGYVLTILFYLLNFFFHKARARCKPCIVLSLKCQVFRVLFFVIDPKSLLMKVYIK